MSQSTQAYGTRQTPIGLYIHVPFCARKCPYCDFNTYAGLGALHERTVAALCVETGRASDGGAAAWLAHGDGCAREVTSVFVGGGTPTVLTSEQLAMLMAAVRRSFVLAEDCEITVEANPGTVDRLKFEALRALGVNRLSIGVQSFQQHELAFLGRIHDVDDVYAAFEAARLAGFDNVNLDFMFGLPQQDAAAWEDTLAKATALGAEHLSLYSLIVEPETPLFRWVEDGRVDEPDDDVAGELYELAMARLAEAGYVQYEVSNWALATGREKTDKGPRDTPKLACRHNLVYWRNGEWAGVGPGAHSHRRGVDGDGRVVSRRWSNVKPVPDYLRRVEAGVSPVDYHEEVDFRGSMGETMMLGLRLVREGVSMRRFAALHGAPMLDVFGHEVERLREAGLLAVDGDTVCLTRRGLMVGNQVFAAFLPAVA